jgi:hypothetical protein
MAKACSPDVLDGALNIVRTNATRMVACAGQPASYAAANSGKLAEAVMASGDFTLAAGVTNGRRATVAAKSNVSVLAAGTADHVALLDPTGSRLLYVTTCPAQALVIGGTVSFAAWDIEIGDPV